MKITVTREIFDDQCSIGSMDVDDKPQCYTLEPMTRPEGAEKVFGKTAIPYGKYPVTITFSGHFQRDMPLVNNVPGFDEIRIHPGNWPSNTEGCCLVGVTKGVDMVGNSVAAFEPLFTKIKSSIDSGDTVTIEYTHD